MSAQEWGQIIFAGFRMARWSHSVENPLRTYAGLGAIWFMGVMVTS